MTTDDTYGRVRQWQHTVNYQLAENNTRLNELEATVTGAADPGALRDLRDRLVAVEATLRRL